MKCFGCGVEKDLSKPETYPYPDERIDTSEPVEPLFVVECSGAAPYRACPVCHECFHRLEPDMWISPETWAALKPAVPFDRLPPMMTCETRAKWDPANYATI